jgi:hypothetical protein
LTELDEVTTAAVKLKKIEELKVKQLGVKHKTILFGDRYKALRPRDMVKTYDRETGTD